VIQRPLLIPVIVAVLLGAGPGAFAQEGGYVDQLEDRYGPEVVVGSVTALNTERLYVVQENDTLWDLSESFFYDTWMWPLLWALNPQITNPHWIYPGDVLFITPPGGTPVEVQSVDWTFSSRFAQEPKSLNLRTRTKGFIAREQFLESGIVRFSRESKQMLSTYDEIFIDFTHIEHVGVGDEYTLYRVDDERVLTNDDGAEIGRIVRFLGTVRILDTTHELVKGIITRATEEIFRDDLVAELQFDMPTTSPVPNKKEQSAKVIDAFYEIDEFAEHIYIFIDKGKRDGVVPGNRFIIRERGDPYFDIHRTEKLNANLKDFPWQDVGSIMVVQTFDNHCLGVITSSIHEIGRGQELYMYANY
jgi:hypothetical protein